MKTDKVKIIAYIGIIALLVSMVVGILGYSSSTKDIQDIKDRLLTDSLEYDINLSLKYLNSYYGTLTQGQETLLDSEGNSIEGNHELVDVLSEDLGNRATVFVKIRDDFKRISTNIMNDGSRAVGTYLGTDHAAYELVMNGGVYIGEAGILGEKYYTAYAPIKDQNNNVIGLLFVGTPTENLDKIIDSHDTEQNRTNVVITVLRTVSLGALIVLVAVSVMGKPVGIKDKKSEISQKS